METVTGTDSCFPSALVGVDVVVDVSGVGLLHKGIQPDNADSDLRALGQDLQAFKRCGVSDGEGIPVEDGVDGPMGVAAEEEYAED